ncbi:MAG: type II secretion system protein [Candidatus Cloacimonetes bacterium]|nr:type II secretion system protein [Candidatus Cloacimonadota bacterium]
MKTLNKKAFTMVEIAVSIGVMGIIFLLVANLRTSPAKMSKQSIEEIVAFSQGKRILKILTQEFKGAQKILYPIKDKQKGNYCAIQKKDGQIFQFYLNSANTFVSKNLSSSDKKEVSLVRQNNPKVQLDTFIIVNNANKGIDVYLKYKKLVKSKQENFFELFDSVAIHE